MKFIYYFFSTISLPILLIVIVPFLWFRRIWGRERLGLINQKEHLSFVGSVWLHGASVGEVNVLLPLINEYMKTPHQRLIVTTMTATGQKYVREKCTSFSERVDVFFIPLDFWYFCRKAFLFFKPQKIVIAETELWPAFYLEATRFGIPLAIVNGRISDKSYSNYLKLKKMISIFLKPIQVIYAQTQLDRERFLELGVDEQKVKVFGNLKNDGLVKWLEQPVEPTEFFVSSYRVVFGSLRPKEAAFMIEVILLAKAKGLPFKFIVAPRHFDWLDTFYKMLEQQNILFQIASRDGFKPIAQGVQLLVIDQIGLLQKAYQGALLAFVGGTLFLEYGGHNGLEPAALGVPIRHGPYFKEQIYNTNALLKAGASKIVHTPEELIRDAEELLSPVIYASDSLKCKQVVNQEAKALGFLRKENFFE